MASAQPLRTELFRFLSLRAPQLIASDRKDFGFIRHPAPKDSHFLRGLQDIAEKERYAALRTRAATFTPQRSRQAVRDLAPALYDFAQQLFARRAAPRSVKEIAALARIDVPDDAVVLQLWDNVFFQLLERRNIPVHQACVQLLIAHHMVRTVRQPRFADRLRGLTEGAYPKRTVTGDAAQEQWLQRLGRARLLIPDAFSTRRVQGGKTGGAAAVAAASGPGAAEAVHGVYQLGVGVFRRVEQEVCCYVPGEVSHVENIMAREYKERHTRSLTTSETTTEESTESEQEQTSDTSTAQRHEMQSAVATVLNQSTQIGVGATTNFSGDLGTVTLGATASFDYGTANATSISETEALTEAQEVTQQALARVVSRTATKRVSRMLQEFEENNRHGFDNREGDQHVTGIYRWLDIVYVNRIINYGVRQMVEFVIPDPARFYVKSVRQAGSSGKGKGTPAGKPAPKPEPPPTLKSLEITSAADITRDNVAKLERTFDTTLPDPPTLASDTEGVSLEPLDDRTKGRKPDPDGKQETYNFELLIPQGYKLTNATLGITFDYHYGTFGGAAAEDGTFMRARMAGQDDRFDEKHPIGKHPDKKASRSKPISVTLPVKWDYSTDLTGSVTLRLDMKNVHDFTVTGTLTFGVSDSMEAQWRDDAYDALVAARSRLVDAYERDLAAWKSSQDEPTKSGDAGGDDVVFGSSPDANRAIEQREIKRLAIEMIAFPFGHAVGEDHMVLDACKVPSVNQNKAWDTYASHAKFYEQAFEWEAMSYSFYPYYWADRCDWADRLQLTAPADPLFEGFLQAGMARVIAPVRLGFEEAVNLYLETGAVWNGSDMVIDTEDDLYVSITEELQEPESVIEDTWQTRVPTTLTIVQGDSIFLEDEGLPCCNEVHPEGVNPLKSKPLRLKGRAS